MSDDCLFCRIAAGEIPSQRVFEDEEIVAFRDIAPQAPVHLLVIPRRHFANLLEAAAGDARLTGRLLEVAATLAREHGLADNGFRVVFNTLADGGQTVPHIHLHLLGGRALSWPPG
ncbi:MAG: histidine triad nucleotide-binding protein [Thermoanaerobaculia bacterium]